MAVSIEVKRAHNARILSAVIAANGLIVDGHNGGQRMIQMSHVATFGQPGVKESIVCLLEGKLFCLNPVELNRDGTVELSTCSIGGNLMHKELPMAERLSTYEDWDKNQLWDLVAVQQS